MPFFFTHTLTHALPVRTRTLGYKVNATNSLTFTTQPAAWTPGLLSDEPSSRQRVWDFTPSAKTWFCVSVCADLKPIFSSPLNHYTAFSNHFVILTDFFTELGKMKN